MTLASEVLWLWHVHVSYHDSCKWVTTLTSESLWLSHECHHDLVNSVSSSGMLMTKAIYNNYLIHLLTLHITIITHILCRVIFTTSPATQRDVAIHTTCLFWGCIGQLWSCNISFFRFTVRPFVLQTLPRWIEINNQNYYESFSILQLTFKAYSKDLCMSYTKTHRHKGLTVFVRATMCLVRVMLPNIQGHLVRLGFTSRSTLVIVQLTHKGESAGLGSCTRQLTLCQDMSGVISAWLTCLRVFKCLIALVISGDTFSQSFVKL